MRGNFSPELIDVLRPLKRPHRWLMLVLRAQSDSDGQCIEGLRAIAAYADEPLSTVQKHLSDMEALGYFKRSQATRGGMYVYRLAPRFLNLAESTGRDTRESIQRGHHDRSESNGRDSRDGGIADDSAHESIQRGHPCCHTLSGYGHCSRLRDAPTAAGPVGKAGAVGLDADAEREWLAAAYDDRERHGWPKVDLTPHWRNFLKKAGGRLTLKRWIGWARRAQPFGKADHAGAPHPQARRLRQAERGAAISDADRAHQARVTNYRKTGQWHPHWGDPPSASETSMAA